ncbi:MAG TPA: multidrug ABC transporter ATP-binding protein [Bdellovibrionales bacterium]|nr:multidrug ABC transporter ATP-binding protein [Pseudobdellovibrionaceae bacterium]HAG90248.1 multidrug ABC transporter ATP-binding protein [Bdellovibrionales bacterium]
MSPIISIHGLSKTYKGGFQALKNIDLSIQPGELFALLGPNGAGKTTLIGTVCGLVTPSEGKITVSGHDILKDYRKSRQLIGLVPQELTTDAFETVWNTVSFSRGLFGLPKNPEHIEKVLKSLSLWDKRNNKLMTLSGGMKRRVLIAKALSHEPKILFLDEPTAGVDVELRKDMWQQIQTLKDSGVTVILTTHYIEEAEQMADRIGVINHGQLILIEEKRKLIQRMGQKRLLLDLQEPLAKLPDTLKEFDLELLENGLKLVYSYDSQKEDSGIADLLSLLGNQGVKFKDLKTEQSSLEEIFVNLVRKS